MQKLLLMMLLTGLCMLISVGNVAAQDNEISVGLIKFTEFKAMEIIMYKQPGKKPFDKLILAYEEFDVGGKKVKALEFYTKNDNQIWVYDVKLGWNAASQIKNNAYYHSGELIPQPWPGVPGPEYILEFAVAGDPEAEWLKIVPYIPVGSLPTNVDGAGLGSGFEPPKPFYIKRDMAYMEFMPWEEVIRTTGTFKFNPENVVICDGPNGTPIEKPFEVYGGLISGKIEGDWLPAVFFANGFEFYETQLPGWIKWRDEDGLLIRPEDVHLGGPLI